ncbi:MAG: hypothetical protein QOF78_3307 [Phycisphaerales bacterium]|jgi:autotransporter-associated beta strand protein|nr:hypothetical protein [Phycisphaerales bacterium]
MRNDIQPLESRRLLSSTLAMYTYAGDVNLDGIISGDDYVAIDNALNNGNPFYAGDYNYDGVIDSLDLPGAPPRTDFSGTAKNDVITVTAGSAGAVNVAINGKLFKAVGGKLTISGNGGDDKIHIGLPDEYAGWLITINGGAGNDAIVGSAAAERIVAGDGNDFVLGNGGRDTIYAEAGDDSVRGGGSSDFIDGGAGNDTLRGDAGNDRISGGDGFDRIRGSLGNDSLAGGSSKDFIGGEAGNDELQGDGGADVLAGGEDDDVVFGGAGDDNANGNDGDDFLSGGSGDDQLFGGGGNDGFNPGDQEGEARDVEEEDLEIGASGLTIGNTISSSGNLTKTGSGVLVLSGNNSYTRSGTLSVANAKFDLADNKLIVNSLDLGAAASFSGIQGLVQRSLNGASWDGAGIVTSMPSAITGLTTIGVATGAQACGLGPNDTALWGGQTITGTSTLVMYTYVGDTNLDGVVDAADSAMPPTPA